MSRNLYPNDYTGGDAERYLPGARRIGWMLGWMGDVTASSATMSLTADVLGRLSDDLVEITADECDDLAEAFAAHAELYARGGAALDAENVLMAEREDMIMSYMRVVQSFRHAGAAGGAYIA